MGGKTGGHMDILVVDPDGAIEPTAKPAFAAKGWQTTVTTNRARAFATTLTTVPDLVVLHGDGVTGETVHLCQRFKENPLTVGIPLVLIEDSVPPTWLLTGLPVDAVTQAPWEPHELIHHIEVLASCSTDTAVLDDLTNFPRRRSIITELQRRMVSREMFAAGILSLREADAYRQDFGRSGLDHFIVLVSVLLRRNGSSGTPISIGYLDEGSFLILGAQSMVHEVISSTIRDFEALVPAYYEMDTIFKDPDADIGPTTWIGVQGGVCLVEPERFDNVLQVGFVLGETIAAGHEVVRQATLKAFAEVDRPVAAD